MKDPPWANKPSPKKSRRRKPRRHETFDEAVNKDVSQTNRRRSSNSGFRRFRHLMRKPDFSKKFWIGMLAVLGLLLVLLIVWDVFFRYAERDADPDVYYNNITVD